MAQGQPQTKSKELQEKIEQLYANRELDRNHFSIRVLRRDIEALGKVNRPDADFLLAALDTYLFNEDDAFGHIKSLRLHRQHEMADLAEFYSCAAFLYASRTNKLFDAVLGGGQAPIGSLLRSCAISGNFQKVSDFLEAHRENEEMSEVVNQLSIVSDLQRSLESIGVPEQKVLQTIDAAGEVIRSRKWHRPGFSANDPIEIGGPVALRYCIKSATPEEATEATSDLIDKIIERDLFCPGFVVTFTGEAI